MAGRAVGGTPSDGDRRLALIEHSKVITCPRCSETGTLAIQPDLARLDYIVCEACGYPLPVVDGIPNFAESLTPRTQARSLKQRIMETRLFASLYETPLWRPLHTYLASGMTVEKEQQVLFDLAGDAPKSAIVDLACGTGHFTRSFARRWSDAAVVGLDLSLNMLRKGLSRALAQGTENIVFLRGSIFDLPFADGSVDMANCCGALHLFHDQPAIWREVARVLRPGGVFTAEAVARDDKVAWIQDAMSYQRGFRFLEPEVLRTELQDAGLTDMEYEQRRVIITFRAFKKSHNV